MNNLQKEIQAITKKINDLQKEDDPELRKLVIEEVEKLKIQKKALEDSIRSLDTESAVMTEASKTKINPDVALVEIRAGTGGDEAAIFANDLLRMYLRYSEIQKWNTKEIFKSENDLGGIKTVSIEIKGNNVYETLKNESGVHRVQRVPVTESSGRIHTSTATVAVLPKLTKIHIDIKPEDLEWEFYRAGGKGGQNVNKVSTAVRLTHIPTQVVVECQEERSQGKNREKALGILQSKLFNAMDTQRVKNLTELRAAQVGTAERSEKIRTYNFPQNRVTDHRIKKSYHNISSIMDGNIDKILNLYPKT